MIKKIIEIKNIGRFNECGSHGNVEFLRQTYLFAENSRGKSTVCAILRSLQSGDPAPIEGRKRLGQTSAPEVVIRLENRNASYRNGQWDAPYPDLMVFDDTFVHENVFAGNVIDHGHKRNLHRVIIGRQGVALARSVDGLDGLIRDANRELASCRSAVEATLPRGMSLPDFLALPSIAEATQRIEAQEEIVAAATQASARAAEIRGQAGLRNVEVLRFPMAVEDFVGLLGTRLGDVNADVEATVREHLVNHTRGGRQAWLAEGRRIQRDDDCPYCAQSTAGLPIIRDYAVLFADAYTGLRQRVANAQTEVERTLSPGAIVGLQGAVGENDRLNEFWRTLVGSDVRNNSLVADLRAAAEELRLSSAELLTTKHGAPLEPLAISDRFRAAHRRWEELRPTVDVYNAAVGAMNRAIEEFKARTPAADLAAARRDLDALRNSERRHSSATVAVVEAFQLANSRRARLDREKVEAKAALDSYSAQVFGQYQARINELLTNFNAGFRIGQTESSYVGGRPSSSYKIVINEVAVALGDGDTPTNTPSFRNTLSGGDRSALAFAFSSLKRSAIRPLRRSRSCLTIRIVAKTVRAKSARSKCWVVSPPWQDKS